MKKLYTLPKYLGFMLGFYPQTQFGVRASETIGSMNETVTKFLERLSAVGPVHGRIGFVSSFGQICIEVSAIAICNIFASPPEFDCP